MLGAIAQLVRAGVLYTSGPWFKSMLPYHFGTVAELADALGLGPSILRCGGSNPLSATIYDSVVELAYTTDLKSVDHIGLAGSSPATVTTL
jgi:hypothetical protein